MHMYAKCDKNISFGSSVMSIFTNWNKQTDGYQTDSHSGYSADPKVVQYVPQDISNVSYR